MIKIAGKEFRTLAQPIFVNDRHVREVWANGVRVYPETMKGDIIKIRGYILQQRAFQRPDRNMSRYDPWMDGKIQKVNGYTDNFSVSASFAAVLQYGQDAGIHEDGVTLIPLCGERFDSEKIPTEGHGQYFLPYEYIDISWSSSGNYLNCGISPICMPFSPQDGSPVPVIPSIKISLDNPSSLRAVKMLFRIDMSPIPLSSEYLYTYYVPLSYYHQDIIRPMYSGLLTACDWNGKIIRSEDVSSFSVPHPWNQYASMSVGLGYQEADRTSSRRFPSHLSVSFYRLMERATLISNHRDSSEAKIIASVEKLVNIPITDVLYVGRAEDAPEWALDVSESDLL